MTVNAITAGLKPFPMLELTRTADRLRSEGRPVYDFGTGDPRVPTWENLCQILRSSIPAISQYPRVQGNNDLIAAMRFYLGERFGLDAGRLGVLPTQGSKEAIFHIALTLSGRLGKKTLVYPTPGYPVYNASALFSHSVPHPVILRAEDGYLLQPWRLLQAVQDDAFAVWVNYPHNPTGAVAPEAYWRELLAWARKQDCLILSDDCYVDVYDTAIDEERRQNPAKDRRPLTALQSGSERLICFMSLSKRSGMTGYRSGFMAGDNTLLQPILRARANFGVGIPDFIQTASVAAWRDDAHVAARRKIFSERARVMRTALKDLGFHCPPSELPFYVWVQPPVELGSDDIAASAKLAEHGVLCTPSQWLGEGTAGWLRFALVPDDDDVQKAIEAMGNALGKTKK